jgi:ribonuclease BN (tRNA processing enzyme)
MGSDSIEESATESDPNDVEGAMAGVSVHFLGTGDAFGSGGRLQTATLLRSAAGQVLVDCGASALAALRAQRLDPCAVDTVALTHLHGDHLAGLPFLLMDAHFAVGRTRPLTIVGPPGTAEAVARAHDVFFPGTGVLPLRFPITWIEFASRVAVAAGPCRVTAYPVMHSTAMPCFGLRVELGGGVFACSGDTEWTETLVEIAADADLFLCECFGNDTAPPHHMTLRALQQHRHRLACRRMLLTHMGEEMLAQASELGLDAAHDGLVVQL